MVVKPCRPIRAGCASLLVGREVEPYLNPALPAGAAAELAWSWDALRGATKCGSFAVFYKGKRMLQAGVVPARAEPLEPEMSALGTICTRAMESGKGNYLANLALAPGRVEFESFLPINTQAVVVQPIGDEGVIIAASNTARGFTPVDQAWVSLVADKLGATLDESGL